MRPGAKPTKAKVESKRPAAPKSRKREDARVRDLEKRLSRDGTVEVSVTDTGVGIAPEDQEAVFEEFRQVGTADKKVEGTGLGLALSRKFIELHGGRIWVESQVGEGSTFTVTVPVRSVE
jgi:signal transduction histidine kinase